MGAKNEALAKQSGIVTAIVSGQSPGKFTGAMLDEMNARHAKEYADCTRAGTIVLLEKGAAAAAAVVRGLSEDQLARSGAVFTDAPPMANCDGCRRTVTTRGESGPPPERR